MNKDIRAINMEFEEPEDVNLIELSEDENLQRSRYGVSVFDTYSLHTHLAAVMANSLRLLAANLHGWPCSEDFPEFDDWKNALFEVANKMEFVASRDDLESVIYNNIDFSRDEEVSFTETDHNTFLVNTPNYKPGLNEYIEKTAVLQEVADRFKNEAMEWLSKYWWHLWD